MSESLNHFAAPRRRPITSSSVGLVLVTLIGCGEEPTAPMVEAPAPTSTPAAIGRWITRAPYPGSILYAASASVTDPATLRSVLYVVGGSPDHGIGHTTKAVKAYVANTNVWQSKAPYPLPVRRTNGAVEIGGKIYVSGGESRRLDQSGDFYRVEPLNRLYVYNPGSNTWTRRRDMPRRSSLGVSGTLGGKLYVATMCHAKQFCLDDDLDAGALWRYDPASNTWALLGPTPHPPQAGGFIGGRLYLVDRNGLVDAYDPATNAWSAGGPTGPMSFCEAPTFTTFQAKLYIVGCSDGDPVRVLIFDPKAGSWSTAATPGVAGFFGSQWTLSRIVVNGRPRLELVGGGQSANNRQYIPD
jgi:hypothetical protein